MNLEYFQLVDRIVALNLDERRITVHAQIPPTSTIFQGHFPGYPLMPGVLLIEAMAQTSGWLVVAMNRFERMAFLAQVKDAKFRTFVTPGQTLAVKARVVHEGSGYAVTETSISIHGKPVCDATLTLRILDFPNQDVRNRMRETAARVGFPSEVSANG